MGDPMHGRPAVISYGVHDLVTPPENNTVVFMPTNDGFLHAISGPSKGGGNELWAFVPPELLNRLNTLRQDTPADHTYGLDGDIRVLRMDKNQNGKIDSGDRVWLFFGMRARRQPLLRRRCDEPAKRADAAVEHRADRAPERRIRRGLRRLSRA